MGRREENKRQKREALLGAGLSAFLEAGYDGASIEVVAASAGVARGTFYLYFPDKLSLFRALMERWVVPVEAVLDEVVEQIPSCRSIDEVRGVYEQMGAALAAVGLTRSDEILVAFRQTKQPDEGGVWLREVELRLLDKAISFTEQASSRGLIQVADPRLAVLVVFGAVERLFYEVLVGTDLGDPDIIASTVVGLFGATMGFGVSPPRG